MIYCFTFFAQNWIFFSLFREKRKVQRIAKYTCSMMKKKEIYSKTFVVAQFFHFLVHCDVPTYLKWTLFHSKVLDSSLNLDLDPIAGLADLLEETDIFPYSQIPNFPMSVSIFFQLFKEDHFTAVLWHATLWLWWYNKNSFWLFVFFRPFLVTNPECFLGYWTIFH